MGDKINRNERLSIVGQDKMARILDLQGADFEQQFFALLHSKREVSQDVDARVADIIDHVRTKGDEALFGYSRQFDRCDVEKIGLRIKDEEIETAFAQIPTKTMQALELAHERVSFYHHKQLPHDAHFVDTIGVELGWRWSAVESVGLYVPGGSASYPSSVLMNAIPAKVAGVERVVMVVPTPDGMINPLVLAAAKLAQIDEIYRIGGAQAVAALALGTSTIAPVAKIVGPGNAYVASAKRQLFGRVGIDMIAGPSEIIVLADAHNDADWIGADLLAQAEHDVHAQSILITDSAQLAMQVQKAVAAQLKLRQRAEIAQASWRDFGAIILVETLEQAVPLINRLAPEHLELAIDRPEDLLPQIRNAGAIFIGRHTPEVIGDYVGGSNHVLPTARSARFSSPLGVLDFMKRSSILKLGAEQLAQIGPAAIELAFAEGLDGHAHSVGVRLNMK